MSAHNCSINAQRWAAVQVGDSGGENSVSVYEIQTTNGNQVAEYVLRRDATLIAAAPEMQNLLRNVLDAFWIEPNARAQESALKAVEALLWRLDGNAD